MGGWKRRERESVCVCEGGRVWSTNQPYDLHLQQQTGVHWAGCPKRKSEGLHGAATLASPQSWSQPAALLFRPPTPRPLREQGLAKLQPDGVLTKPFRSLYRRKSLEAFNPKKKHTHTRTHTTTERDTERQQASSLPLQFSKSNAHSNGDLRHHNTTPWGKTKDTQNTGSQC